MSVQDLRAEALDLGRRDARDRRESRERERLARVGGDPLHAGECSRLDDGGWECVAGCPVRRAQGVLL